MMGEREKALLAKWQKEYPEKFAAEDVIFNNIHKGDRIFISTGCGEPQYLVSALMKYVESHPKAFAEAEVIHIWTLGVAPYTDQNYTYNFRHNSFFVGAHTRDSVNAGFADYTPISLFQVPGLISSGRIPIDVALIQTSLPDENGYLSLGISLDISKSAIEKATLVIAQVNSNMPIIHGDTFIHISEINYLVPHDEPLLTYYPKIQVEVAKDLGKYVARIINDGDTIQVGYGATPDSILPYLEGKKNLGVHTELLSDSMIGLIKKGVIDNSKKNIDRGRTVATFCMGNEETYHFINNNPTMEFRTVDYTNDPLIISRINNMTCINSALQIDLTGQATAESIGKIFYSGIGGSTDFMRGVVRAPGGKSILVLPSTAQNDMVSRIVPFLDSGAGVTFNRGDIHYVVTEYGIAYIHGKNIRERAMDLVALAHPKFRGELIENAKRLKLIYGDQAYIPGKKGEYPEHLEVSRTTKTGLRILLRPVKINDEPLVKDLFYSLSEQSLQRRFLSVRKDVPHKLRQMLVVIDYTVEIFILATVFEKEKEIAVGMGQYVKDELTHTADIAFAVREKNHNMGIGTELLSYLTLLAKKEGLQGFTADVMVENTPMLHVFGKMGFDIQKTVEYGSYNMELKFVPTGV